MQLTPVSFNTVTGDLACAVDEESNTHCMILLEDASRKKIEPTPLATRTVSRLFSSLLRRRRRKKNTNIHGSTPVGISYET